MLYIYIYIANLPVDIVERGAENRDQPLLISGHKRGRPVVLYCNAAASAQGICPGMTVGAARALVSALRCLARNTEAEQQALTNLALWAGRFTPDRSLDPPQGLLLDVGSSLRLFGGAHDLLELVSTELTVLGYAARIAMAPTPLAAGLLARAMAATGVAEPVLQRAALPARLADMPLITLRQPAKQAEILHRMGLRRIGELQRLPRAELARRIDPELPALLDRLLGYAPDPQSLFKPPTRYRGQLAMLPEATETAPVLFAARRLLAELTGALRAHCAGAQTLHWRLQHPDGSATDLRFNLPLPTHDAQRLLMLMRERLARQPLHGPVRELTLTTGAFTVLRPETPSLLPDPGHLPAADAGWLVAQLSVRLGPGAVCGIRLAADHRPERSWETCTPALHPSSPPIRPCPKPSRPLWLLTEPLLLDNIGHYPSLNGRLVLTPGAERLGGSWWENHAKTRDYFRARSPQGARLWVYCNDKHAKRWYLHGIYA